MKKIICFVLLLSVIFSFGCSKIDDDLISSTNEENNTGNTAHSIDYSDDNVILPKVRVNSINLAKEFSKVDLNNFTIASILDNTYYGYKSTYTNGYINDEFMLIDSKSGKAKNLNYPKGLANWSVGSGSTVILQDRYIYEWKSYSSEFSEKTDYDVKLTRIDAENGSVEIVDELKYSTPLIYMCKINDTEFLSYSKTQAPSDRTEYAVISSAWIYNINGEKRKIVNEKYENDVSWTDSEGILIERFAVKDGNLFGLGRRRISGKYQFFLYHFDKNGKLLKEETLIGFENIIGDEQMLELHLIGDYIVFRTYESLTTYICKKSNIGTELVMKGADQQVQYAVGNNYIFFIENNVNVYSGEVETKDCPIYIIDAQNDKICATKFLIDLKEPYFVGLQAPEDGSLIVRYCDGGEYDPMKIEQYMIEHTDLYNRIENLF